MFRIERIERSWRAAGELALDHGSEPLRVELLHEPPKRFEPPREQPTNIPKNQNVPFSVSLFRLSVLVIDGGRLLW